MAIKMKFLHLPSSHGHGKWHDLLTLWAYKIKRRKANKVAARSRAKNRH